MITISVEKENRLDEVIGRLFKEIKMRIGADWVTDVLSFTLLNFYI